MSFVHQISSGSEGDPQYVMVDDKKKRRMISNRESARRSRMKKQQHLDDLLNQVVQLQKKNNEIANRVNATTQVYNNVESENKILRAQMMELTDRLQSLNSVLRIVEEVSGFAMDIPEIPDPLLKPWQLPCPSQPIMASADMFQC
ncbi:Basic-leucine zipper domain [Macleaya cordata]|uniref:Basic-leucine zipper domain n=1 Tax=Macleaya cordata TaxID=56857 RepID=A0A200PWI3_MACCD|nr:Basic-leucine zipper domain [Macleaya cordata]